jgi:hypothetical protein
MKRFTDAGENIALGNAAGVAFVNRRSQFGKFGLVLLYLADAVFLFRRQSNRHRQALRYSTSRFNLSTD